MIMMRVLISFITGVAIVACLMAGSSATFFGRSNLERCLEDCTTWPSTQGPCSCKMKCFKRNSWLDDFNPHDPCISNCFYGKCCRRRGKCSVRGHFKALRKCMCRCDGEHVRYVTSKPAPATYTTTQQVDQGPATTLPLTSKPAPATTTQQVDQGAATTLPLTTPEPTDRMTTTIEMTTAEAIEIPTQLPV